MGGLKATRLARIVSYAPRYKSGSKTVVVGKIDRLKSPPPSAELRARKRRHAGRPPFWPANRIAKLRKLLGIKSYAAIGLRPFPS